MQELLRVVEKLVVLPCFHAEGVCGERRGDCALGDCGVGWNVADFIDCDRSVAFERGFQLLGKCSGLRADAGGEGFHHTGERGLRDPGRKMNAGDACGGEEPGEAFFGGGGFKCDAVEKQLIAGNGEQQTRFVIMAQSGF